MDIPKKLLVCVDLSEYSAEVIEYAAMMKKSWRCEVVILNIINKRDIESLQSVNNYLPNRIDIDAYVERLTLERKQQIKDIIMTEEANELLDAPLIFRTGHPAEGILEMTENEPFDLVIMGRKGRSNLANVLFGSTAERVFKHSTKPVLIVRRGK